MAFKWIIRHSRPQIPALTVVTILNGIYALFSVAFALFCRGIIDSAVAHNTRALWFYGVGMFVAHLFAESVGSERISAGQRISQR